VRKDIDVYFVKEYFKSALYKTHGPFESREQAEMFLGHHDLGEPGVEFFIETD
jgi:hypothetical protein